MTFDKFTIKAQETVQEAVNLAQRSGQQSIEPVHLLKAIMTKARDVAGFIFQQLGVSDHGKPHTERRGVHREGNA